MDTVSLARSRIAQLVRMRSPTTSAAVTSAVLAFTLSLVCCFVLLQFQKRKVMRGKPRPEEYYVHPGPRIAHRHKTDRTRRTTFGDVGCNIYGWPSCGGLVIRTQADAIEMQYLGLDRLEPLEKRFKDQKNEDAFCIRLMNIGGKWCPSEERAALVWSELNCITTGIEDETEGELRQVWVGWPESGGVLVAEYQNQVGKVITPHDIGRLRMAHTMEERCQLLKTKFGAVYYKNPQEYTGFSSQHTILSGHRPKS